MLLPQLRSFIEVYRQQSLSSAARSLGLTQPAISQHIAALEAAIGQPLFVRHAKGVTPTISADDLAAGLGDRLDVAEAVLAQARARSGDITGVVRIMGQADFIAEMLAPRLLPLLQSGMRFRMKGVDSDEMREALLNGQCDLAISAYPLADQKLRSEFIHKERLHAVAAPSVAGRIMAGRDLAIALRNEAVLAFHKEQHLVHAWINANMLGDMPMQAALISQDLRSLQSIVMKGFGWCVLPDYLCLHHIEAGELAEIPAPVATPVNRYNIVWLPKALRESRVAVAHAEICKIFAEIPAR